MAKYNKKRARELKHDRFRDATMLLADRLADRVGDHRKQILYGLIGLVIVAIGIYALVRWRHKHADEAATAMGRAIAINDADVGPNPPPGSRDPFFTSQQERSEAAIREFEKVAAKYGEPYRTEARYFIAVNELVTDRPTKETFAFELFQVVVECGDEDQQRQLYEELVGRGWKCRLLNL